MNIQEYVDKLKRSVLGGYIFEIVVISLLIVTLIILLLLYYRFIIIPSKLTENKVNTFINILFKGKILILSILLILFLVLVYMLVIKIQPSSKYIKDYQLINEGKFDQIEYISKTRDRSGRETERSIIAINRETGEETRLYFVGSPVEIGDRLLVLRAPNTGIYVVVRMS